MEDHLKSREQLVEEVISMRKLISRMKADPRDITGSEQVKTALKESDEKFRLAFSASPDAININRLDDGLFVDINEGFTRLTGYTRDVVIGKTSLEINIWHDFSDREKLVQALQEKGFCENLEAEFQRKDGSLSTGLMSARIFSLKGVAHIISITRDISERKKIEKALSESRERLKEAHRLANIGLWNWIAATDTVTWSEQLCRIAGVDLKFPPPTFAEHTKFFAPASWTMLKAAVEKATETGAPYQLELELIRPDDSRRWVLAFGGAMYDPRGLIIGLQGTVQDITERRQAEDALRESEERFHIMADSSPMILWVSDQNGGSQFVNRTYREFFGITLEQAQGNAWQPLVHPDDAPLYVESFLASVRERRPFIAEARVRRADGEWRCVESHGEPRFSSGGEFLGHVGVSHDITERKRAEESLSASEERFRRMFQHSAAGMVLVSPERLFLHVNGGFCLMLGYTESELLGKTIQDLTHPEDRLVGEDLVRRVLSGEIETFQLEKRYLCKDGTVVWGLVSTTLIRDAQNRPLHLVAQIQDITKRKQAEAEKVVLEAQLQQAQKMESVGRLAGGVAHDFNNMLEVILGHAELALDQVDPAQPLHHDLIEIRKAAERSADLTRQLLAFARKQTIAPRVLDLNETVTGMLSMMNRLIGEDINLSWQPEADLWPVRADPSQIDQILANLCVNARDAISGVGKITIETRNRTLDRDYCSAHPGLGPGEYVTLAVSDSGCGMDEETQSHIFEPFFTTKGLGKGTGLGLSTVYGAIKQNNGYIDVSSEPDIGSTFRIYLPRHQARTERLQQRAPAGPSARGRETVLLVEDEPAILKLATRVLEMLGYTVLAASTPGEAIGIARECAGDIHLLMTDIVMPEMNGRNLAKNLMSLYPRLKCLYMSGYTPDVIVHRGVLDEGVAFIQKPFSVKSLTDKLREVLGSE